MQEEEEIAAIRSQVESLTQWKVGGGLQQLLDERIAAYFDAHGTMPPGVESGGDGNNEDENDRIQCTITCISQ